MDVAKLLALLLVVIDIQVIMSSPNHTKIAPLVGLEVVAARPDFDPTWVFQEIEAAAGADSMAMHDDLFSEILESVSKHNANPTHRLQAAEMLVRWAC